MTSSSAYLSSTAYVLPWKKKGSKFHQSFQLRAQSYRDEASNIVDENLVVLKERIKEVRNKERLERCCQTETLLGWNYRHAPAVVKNINNNFRSRKNGELAEFVEIGSIVAATFGLTIFSCTCCLCLVACLLHLN